MKRNPVRNPENTDAFMVDTHMGHYYHIPSCIAVHNHPAVYKELSYAVIKKLKGITGKGYQMHDCVRGR